jgi:lipopolysaccharide export LptBFGC system permease protein LptF
MSVGRSLYVIGRRRRFRTWLATVVGTGAVLVWVLSHFFRSDASHVVLLMLYGVWLVVLLCFGWSAYQNAVQAGSRGRDTDR